MIRESGTMDQIWQAALDGDRLAFNRVVAPNLDELISAARREVEYHCRNGDLKPEDLSAEELVGETLLRAWKGRRERPASMSVKGWLLGLQHRVVRKLIQVDHLERDLWSVSLEAPVPPEPLFDDDESFWEWYQPDDLTRWEDAIPSSLTIAEGSSFVDEGALEGLDPDARQAILLHDKHELSLAEAALIIGRTVRETAAMVSEARRTFR